MINTHHIFKLLRSDNPNERESAAHRLYDSWVANGGHPDDYEIRKRGKKADEATEARINKLTNRAELAENLLENERDRSQNAREQAKREREARERADAELVKLRAQLNKTRAKAPPDPTERVDIFSGLMSQQTLDALVADQIGERMQTLFAESELRQHNTTAQVDLAIGQLVDALYLRHREQFGKRKRGSNTPTVSVFLEGYAGKSASWCRRRCYKAFTIVTTDDWNASSWDGTGGIEGIIKSSADPNRPTIRRVNKAQQKLDALTDAVRRKEWEDAEKLVSDWDTDG